MNLIDLPFTSRRYIPEVTLDTFTVTASSLETVLIISAPDNDRTLIREPFARLLIVMVFITGSMLIDTSDSALAFFKPVSTSLIKEFLLTWLMVAPDVSTMENVLLSSADNRYETFLSATVLHVFVTRHHTSPSALTVPGIPTKNNNSEISKIFFIGLFSFIPQLLISFLSIELSSLVSSSVLFPTSFPF